MATKATTKTKSAKTKKLPFVGLKELRENMEEYIERVNAGERITVLRRSKPLFQLTPVDEWGDEGQWETVDLRDDAGKGVDAKDLLASIRSHG